MAMVKFGIKNKKEKVEELNPQIKGHIKTANAKLESKNDKGRIKESDKR